MSERNRHKLDRAEIADLYARHGSALLGYASSLLCDRSAAEDILHQLFLNLLDPNALAPLEIRPYLFRAVRNAALNRRRIDSRQVAIGAAEDLWFEVPDGNQESALALESALRTLPQDQREVVVMHVWAEMTFEEIGGILDISVNTAASRYRYAVLKLRNQMISRPVME